MIKSTNQVTQMFVVDASVELKKVGDKGFNLVIDGNDTTDFVGAGKVLWTNVAKATDTSEILKRKALLVKLKADVNGGYPVAGEDYILTLKFRGDIGEENTIEKVAMVHQYAYDASTDATKKAAAKLFYQNLAKSLIDNASCDYSPLYEIRAVADGALITKDLVATKITETGFYIVEAEPYWRLGTFKESLMKIDVGTRPILVDSDEVDEWLDSYKFAVVASLIDDTKVKAIKNSHKVADMEYFYKGERGTSAFLNHPYDIQIPVELKVDAKHAAGYDILTLHYAYVGDNASNQKSEKDIVLVMKNGIKFTEASGKFTVADSGGKTITDIEGVLAQYKNATKVDTAALETEIAKKADK